MKNLLRKRILTKIAQTQTEQAETAPKALPAIDPLPDNLFSNLGTGYNSETIRFIQELATLLNSGLHYASLAKSSFRKVIENNSSSGLDDISLKIIEIIKSFNTTFLNNRNRFTEKVGPITISNWANALSSKTTSLPQINPTSPLAHNIQGDFKIQIVNLLNRIKQYNPNV